MNIVIVGVGKVGQYLASELSNEGHNILVIDYNAEMLDEVLSANDIAGVVGDATDYATLIEASVGDCDMFIAVTYEDDANIVASIMAKKLGAKYTIARVRKPTYIHHREFMQKTMGIDLLINPEFETSREIIRALDYPEALNVELFFKRKVKMVQVKVPKDSHLGGHTLQELDQTGALDGNLITIVYRDGQAHIPNGDFVIAEGDYIHVAGSKETIATFMRHLFGRLHDIESVLIVGADRISFSLAGLLLDRGMRVKLIEKNFEKARQFLIMHPKAEVVNGDGTAPSTLTEEHAEEFDAFIGLTNIDEENIVLSLVAAEFGIEKRMAKVNRMELVRMTRVLDLDTTVTPKRSVANVILRIVRVKANMQKNTSSYINHIYRLEDNKVEAIDFTVTETSQLVGTPLRDLAIKSGMLVAYILRGDDIYVPRGDDVLEAGDRIIVISERPHITTADEILEG
ncbi:MAG: Trk system potassium transporter TrkA [Aerococcus sp.]|nr:Trk system potassium transporter TrkA [Aerococcus sp.]